MFVVPQAPTKGSFSELWELMYECEYNEIAHPCTRCAARGLPCSKEDKVWGPLRRVKEAKLQHEHVEHEVELG